MIFISILFLILLYTSNSIYRQEYKTTLLLHLYKQKHGAKRWEEHLEKKQSIHC